MSDGGNLDIEVKNGEEDKVLVTVVDDGCGIPEPDLKRIFEPFFSTKAKKGGTGLGLSLTQNFVREMGGTMTVASKVGKGTTFTITLPLKMETKEGGTNEGVVNRR
jgi:two-component system, NtrC family, sensor kinase